MTRRSIRMPCAIRWRSHSTSIPLATREVLAQALAACADAPVGEQGYGVFRM